MTARLTTPHGRFDRAAIIGRARELHRAGMEWAKAISQAYREATAELRSA